MTDSEWMAQRWQGKTEPYTYLWLHEDGTPYYVGKGKGSRAFVHHEHGNCVRCPENLDRIVIQMHSSETDAFIAEKSLIANYGRIDLGTGCLQNMTEGGFGFRGLVLVPSIVRKPKQPRRCALYRDCLRSDNDRGRVVEGSRLYCSAMCRRKAANRH